MNDPKTILAVDDEPVNLELLESILVPLGYHVVRARDGAMAIGVVRSSPPDIILLDVMMPKMDGFEVCRRIRDIPDLPHIPIIFITAMHTKTADVVHGFDVGGDDYVNKPFDPAELVARVKGALRLKRLYDRLVRTKNELARYVSLSTMEMVEKRSSGLLIAAGEARDVVVLFSDIRGFTEISEKLNPEKIFEILNVILSRQIRVIEAHGGIIDKLSGDEVMAVFEGPDRVDRALACGRGIIGELCGENDAVLASWAGVGIGINTGPVYLGSIGSETYRDYTVVGTTVNIAARLCGIAKRFQVLFSESVLHALVDSKIQSRFVGKFKPKGLSTPIDVHELRIRPPSGAV